MCEEQIDIEAGFDDGLRVWVHDEATAEEVMRSAQRVDPIDVLNTLEKLRIGSCAAASYEATTSHLEDRRSGALAKIGYNIVMFQPSVFIVSTKALDVSLQLVPYHGQGPKTL